MEFQGIRSRVYIRFLETLDFGARIFNEFQRFWSTEFSRFLFLFTTAIWMQVMHQTKEPQLPIMHTFLRHWYDRHAHQRVSKYSYSLQPGRVICIPLASSFSIMWGKKWNELVCNFYEVQAQSCQIVFPWQRLQGFGLQDSGIGVFCEWTRWLWWMTLFVLFVKTQGSLLSCLHALSGVKVVMKCACSAVNFAPSYPISTRVADSLGCLVPWTIQTFDSTFETLCDLRYWSTLLHSPQMDTFVGSKDIF